MNNVSLVGRISRDLEAKPFVNQSGTQYVLRSAVAVERDYTSKDGKRPVDFIPFEIWVNENSYNKFYGPYVIKGSLVSLSGALKVDSWKDEAGNNRSALKFDCKKLNLLASPKNSGQNKEAFAGNVAGGFEPSEHLNANEFTAINDDDIPF